MDKNVRKIFDTVMGCAKNWERGGVIANFVYISKSDYMILVCGLPYIGMDETENKYLWGMEVVHHDGGVCAIYRDYDALTIWNKKEICITI
jgi:hypothetical protein